MRNILLMTAAGLSVLAISGCLRTRDQVQGSTQKKEMRQQVVEMQVQKANAESRLIEVEQQMRNLNGRIEVLENQLAQIQAKSSEEQTEKKLREEDFNLKAKAYQEELEKLGIQVQSLEARIGAKSAEPSAKVKDLFAEAEAEFSAKKWKKAIVSYQKYRDQNAKGKNYAEATYKIGVCFQELNMKPEAKVFFQEVIEKFPKSKEAKKANIRLKQIK